MRHMRNVRFVALALGQVINDGNYILRFSVVAHDGMPRRGNDAISAVWCNDRVLVGKYLSAGFQQFEITLMNEIGGSLRKNLRGGLADHFFARETEMFFAGLVDQKIAQAREFLDDDVRRYIVDDRIKKRPCANQLVLGALAFGDVLMRRHPAAAFDRLIDGVDDAAVPQFDVEPEALALLERRAQFAVVARRIERERAGCNAGVEQVTDRAAAPDAQRIDVVHGPVALVPDQQPILRIEHAQTLNHVVERTIEPHILLAELLPDAPGRK